MPRGGVFGWDLPPGVTNTMIEEHFGEREPSTTRCSSCGAFVSPKAWTRSETDERDITYVYTFLYCRKCGHETVIDSDIVNLPDHL